MTRGKLEGKLAGWLRYTMGDSHGELTLDLLEEVRLEMSAAWHPEYRHFGIKPATSPRSAPEPAGDGYPYLMVHANHQRVSGTGTHSFTGVIPMVGIDLPKIGGTHPLVAMTGIGDVYAADIKIASIEEFNAYYGEHFGYKAERVRVFTPPRVYGGRFAAIMFGLVYDVPSAHPRGYYLGGGMATGPTRVLYASPEGRAIKSRGGYSPTPFSDPLHHYNGGLSMNAAGDPDELWIDISKGDEKPHFKLRAKIYVRASVDPPNPAALLLEAAKRVAAIADARGQEVPDLGPLTPVFAKMGQALMWEQAPRRQS